MPVFSDRSAIIRRVQNALVIGVDTGGTFTDLVLHTGGGRPLIVHKLLSTPVRPELAVIAGITAIMARWAGTSGGDVAAKPMVIHGSTVATNALLEGKGGRAAFITTAGFEDTLFIGRQNRSELYALEPAKPTPPVQHEDCIGVHERMAFDGAVLRELSASEVQRIVAAVSAAGVEAVAVSLLHCYANPVHEQRIAQALRRQLPGLHVTVSHELLPEFREYERGIACLINAVAAPRMAAYIGQLASFTGESSLRIMASAGGTLPPQEVLRTPAHTVLSGPAGGVLGALAQARLAGREQIITFDMGGTSTDVALCEGQPQLGMESEINGLPLRLPALAIHTVGAGGGSIAWVDAGGALRTGPQSAGADPGPACYGRQQDELKATVTDAHVVLGHIMEDWPLAGSLQLELKAAQQAIARVAAQAALPELHTAMGILRVAEVVMARAVQRISLEKGYDPRRFTLVPFGGAGGLHAARLAEQLGIGHVLVPVQPGLLSALGMLCSSPLYTYSYPVMQTVAGDAHSCLEALPAVTQALVCLQQQARGALEGDGLAAGQQLLQFSLDMRYAGQSYELNIPFGEHGVAQRFAARHEELYGYSAPDRALEITVARVAASGRPPELQLPQLPLRTVDAPLSRQLVETRIYTETGWTTAWCIERDRLCQGDTLNGPGIIREYSATTLVPAGWRMAVNAAGQLLLDRRAGEDGR